MVNWILVFVPGLDINPDVQRYNVGIESLSELSVTTFIQKGHPFFLESSFLVNFQVKRDFLYP